MENMNNNFYVYNYSRINEPLPYYIGKGKNNRAYAKHRYIEIPIDKSMITFVAKDMEEELALELEEFLITLIGRKDLGTGTLENRSNGGIRPTILSIESKKKMSEAGRKRPPITEETRNKLKARIPWNKGSKGLMPIPWNKDKTYSGQPCSPEKKAKLSTIHKGRLMHERTPEQVAKGIATKVKNGTRSGMLNKKHREESLIKMSLAQKARWTKRKVA